MSTIRFLRTFLAVAQYGSFSEAAEHVALTQAAVSFQMRALENELGRELFDRSGRLALINAAGRELIPDARRMLDLYQHMRRPAVESDGLAGSIAVGAIVSCMGALSRVVSGLKRDHERLDIKVFSGKSSELVEKVEQGELDAAFIVSASRKAPALRWYPVYAEPMVVVAPAATSATTARQALDAHPFLRFDRTQRTGVQIDRLLKRMGVKVDDFLELNAIETVVTLVKQEVGGSLLPLVNQAGWRDDAALQVFDLPALTTGKLPSREIGMIERRDHGRTTVTLALLDRFSQHTSSAG